MLLSRLVILGEQSAHGDEGIPWPVDDVEDHRRRHLHIAGQRFRGGLDQAGHGRLAPGDHALGNLASHQLPTLFGIIGHLGELFEVLHLVVGGLHDHAADGVESGPAGPAGDLMELAGIEQSGAHAVVLRQCREHHGADRDVDADAEGVGAADDLQQARLRELFDQAAVLGQHPGVVHADPVPDQTGQRVAECGREAEAADQVGDRSLLLLGADVDAHQRLCPFQCRGLGEVHDVDRRLLGVKQVADGLMHRGGGIGVEQRYRTFGAGDQGGVAAGAAGEVLPEEGHVTQGGRHQQELGVRQFEQRYLPGPAAVRVAIEVELVHHHQADVGFGALAQRDVGEDLRGAGDDRGIGVHRCVTGEHADIGCAEYLAECEELLADQRLDRCGVEADAVGGQGGIDRAGGDQRLTRTRRGGQDDVRAADQFDQGLFLRRVERGPRRGCPLAEGGEEFVGVVGARLQGHRVFSLP